MHGHGLVTTLLLFVLWVCEVRLVLLVVWPACQPSRATGNHGRHSAPAVPGWPQCLELEQEKVSEALGRVGRMRMLALQASFVRLLS